MMTALRGSRIGVTCVHLSDLCSPDLEQVLPGTADVQAMPYVGMEDIESNTGRVLGSSHQGEVRSNTFAFDARHVLYGKLRPYLNKVALPDRSGRCSTELIPLLPASGVDRQYLAWLLRRPETVSAAMQGKTGSRMPRANMSELFSLVVPLFPLPEQKRIAAKLNQQMATLASAKAALAAQCEAATVLRSAVLRTALDPATHPDWPVLPIGQVTIPGVETWNVIARPNDTKEYVEIAGIDSSSKTIASTHPIVAHAAPSRARNIIHTDDVLVATTRPNLNAVALVPDILDGQVCSTGFAVLRPGKSVLSKWLYWNVRSPRFVQMASDLVVGAMYPAVTDAQVRAICIPVPPLSQQRRIAEYLDSSMKQVDAIVASLGIQGSTLDALRTSLLDAAFGGKV